MALQVMRDCKLFVGGYDLSGDMNAHAIDFKADTVDTTVYGDTSHRRISGLKTISSKHEGVWQAGVGLVDDVLFANLGLKDVPFTICPQTGAEGEPCYSFDALQASYAPGMKMADALRFSIMAEGSDGSNLIRGSILHNAAKTVTGTGTIFNLGAVSSVQKLFGFLHIVAASGTTPSVIVKIQSAPSVGFSAPTDRITFNSATGIGYQSSTPLAGAITDAYWRVSYTIAGTTPSFRFITTMGIQ